MPKFGRLDLVIGWWHFVIGWWHFIIGWLLGDGFLVTGQWCLHLVIVCGVACIWHFHLVYGQEVCV